MGLMCSWPLTWNTCRYILSYWQEQLLKKKKKEFTPHVRTGQFALVWPTVKKQRKPQMKQALLRAEWRQETYREKRGARGKILSCFGCGFILKIKMSKCLLPTRNSTSSLSKLQLCFLKISHPVGYLSWWGKNMQDTPALQDENPSSMFSQCRLEK